MRSSRASFDHLEATQARQAEVADDDIDIGLFERLKSGLTIACLSDDDHIIAGLKERDEPLSNDRMIFYDEDFYHRSLRG